MSSGAGHGGDVRSGGVRGGGARSRASQLDVLPAGGAVPGWPGHRGGRCARRPDDLLHGLDRGWGVEDHRRRRELAKRVGHAARARARAGAGGDGGGRPDAGRARPAASAGGRPRPRRGRGPARAARRGRLRRRRDRGGRRRPVGSERGLRRHRLGLHPRQRLARRRRLPLDRRRRDLALPRACTTPARSAASSSTRTTPTSSASRCSATPSDRTRERGRLPLDGRRADLDEGPLRLRRTRARSTSPSTPPTRGCSTPRSGRRERQPWTTGLGRSGQRPVQDRRRRQHLGEADRRPAARVRSGGSGSRSLGGRRDRVWALVEPEQGGLFRSDDGGEKFRQVSADRELRQRAWYYTPRRRRPAGRRTPSTC